MTRGLLAANIKKSEMILGKTPAIHYAVIFGSSVKDRLTNESDIDFAVAAEQPLEKELYLQLVNSLNSVLSHPVDLIDLNRVSGPILKQALCTGVVVKKTSPKNLAHLIKKFLLLRFNLFARSVTTNNMISILATKAGDNPSSSFRSRLILVATSSISIDSNFIFTCSFRV
jgi:predicted nucleotidyltransferase